MGDRHFQKKYRQIIDDNLHFMLGVHFGSRTISKSFFCVKVIGELGHDARWRDRKKRDLWAVRNLLWQGNSRHPGN
jgi:hypothetical protein